MLVSFEIFYNVIKIILLIEMHFNLQDVKEGRYYKYFFFNLNDILSYKKSQINIILQKREQTLKQMYIIKKNAITILTNN